MNHCLMIKDEHPKNITDLPMITKLYIITAVTHGHSKSPSIRGEGLTEETKGSKGQGEKKTV